MADKNNDSTLGVGGGFIINELTKRAPRAMELQP